MHLKIWSPPNDKLLSYNSSNCILIIVTFSKLTALHVTQLLLKLIVLELPTMMQPFCDIVWNMTLKQVRPVYVTYDWG